MAQNTTRDAIAAPAPTLLPLISGFMASRTVHVAAELGIADLMAERPKTAEILARETGAQPRALNQLLRALASLGIVDEIEPGRFALTPLGAQLRTDVENSVRNLALMFGSERSWRAWGELGYSVRTGAPAMRHVFGMDGFQYLAEHPQQAAIFNAAMAEITRQVARDLVAAYDFAPFRTIVDIGGGNGTLLAAILTAAPKLRGILFDSPTGSAEAPARLAAAGLTDRCSVIAGDFFRSIPSGADAHILKSVIHDWDDEHSATILRNCRDAISADGRLFLVERLMPTRMEASAAHQRWTMLDMHMLVMLGGRERTEQEYRALFASAGFKWERASALPGSTGFSLIEAIPA